ncbi:hypothetical protein K438DRAFT_1942173 [Mycena galopus ATCC 62051]|nr:hypothetical protein K438DRAFT_1942173 [Mycena galopus ATCC 62051]
MPSTRSRAASMHLTYRGGPCLKIGEQGGSQSDETNLILRNGRTGLPSKDGQRELGWNFETRTRQGVGRRTTPQSRDVKAPASHTRTDRQPSSLLRGNVHIASADSDLQTTVLVHGTCWRGAREPSRAMCSGDVPMAAMRLCSAL